jgi:hypothetical protein
MPNTLQLFVCCPPSFHSRPRSGGIVHPIVWSSDRRSAKRCQSWEQLWTQYDENATARISTVNSLARQCFQFSPLSRLKRVEWRREVCRWEKRKRRAMIRSNCARVSPRSRMPVATQRRYTARRAGSGSVMPTQRMTSSIHACCHLVMRAARPKDQAAGNQALEVELPKIRS